MQHTRRTLSSPRPVVVAGALFGVAAATVIACGSPTDVCVAIPVSAVAVHVRDARTGAFSASNTTLIASSVGYADTVSYGPIPTADSLPLRAGNRPGTYSLLVRKPGYRDWGRSGVTVREAAPPCGGRPVTVELDAVLEPN